MAIKYQSVHDIILFDKISAMALVKAANLHKYIILGIDGFFLYPDGKIQPSMENSIDMSNDEKLESNILKALEFLLAQPQNIFFEIILND